MPPNLKRYQQSRQGHLITFTCFHRVPLLRRAKARDVFLRELEIVRNKFSFVVMGYVIMPEHVHLLVSEPERGSLALVVQLLKQNSSRKLHRRRKSHPSQRELFSVAEAGAHFWQRRYYDFNVFTAKKRVEKLKYMHRNPVTRGLVTRPEDWRWSSYRAYAFGEEGMVKLNDWPKITLAAPA